MRRCLTALFITLLSFRLDAASPLRYVAAMEASSWEMTHEDPTLCRMEHVIPRFGKLVFRREAGRPLRLEVETRHRFARGTNVELRSETTGWNGQQTRAVLARLEITGARSLSDLPGDIAERTYEALRRGYQPGFLFYTEQPFIASASTVRFGPAEEEFARCSARLYHDNFADVRVSSIRFEADQEFPEIGEEQRALRRMLAYLDVDDAISEIVVTGHADKTGPTCYNEGLSERRAWYVYELLIAQGIDPALLRVDYFGEVRPLKRGNEDRVHAANRRVTVELRR